MTNILLVPIHLDGLYLKQLEAVVEEMTDYSKLPYFDGQQQRNNDNPYISDTVLSPPFEQPNLNLKPGIHLHWALPDGLTQGIVLEDGSMEFPLVPNRWLIRRSGGGLPDKQWVVESDYLYADGEEPEDTINILHHPTGEDGDRRPFRYLGRNLELSQWQAGGDAEYVEALSTIGPYARVSSLDNEKATFAAFYPNCRSVFGFHDPDCTQDIPPHGLQYDVIGWYSASDKDYFSKFLQEHSGEDTETLLAAIEEELNWKLPEEVDPKTLEGTIYYSRLTFSTARSMGDRAAGMPKPSIAVGNSPTEALAAYLAYQLEGANSERRRIIEEQLEALELSDRFGGLHQDLRAKFEQARHEVGFSGESEGVLWRILPGGNSGFADASNAQAREQITLPTEIAGKLNTLNLLQQEYDRALATIGRIREQVYADWHKYMLALYKGDVEGMDQLPTDEYLRDFIAWGDDKYNESSVFALEGAIANAGTLSLATGTEEEITGADSGGSAPDSIAARLAGAINDIISTLNNFNGAVRQLLSAKNNPSQVRFLLKAEPGERYWEANEPVILMAGDAVASSSRHGRDGRLREDGLLECQLLTEAIDFQGLPEATLELLKAKLDQLAQAEGEKIGFQQWTEQPWHPFMLQWGVQLFPLEHRDGESEGNYDPDLVKNHYQLPVNGVELLLKPGAESDFVESANLYSGACILTPSAHDLLEKQLHAYLKNVLLPSYEGYDGSENYLSLHWQEVKTWYEGQLAEAGTSEDQKVKDPIYTALRAYDMLQSLDCLAQGLGGFNDALLTYKREMQLEARDPLAPSEVRGFHENVREVLARGYVPGSVLRGPLIFNDFNPWRTGALDISGLRILDTFGRVQNVVDLANPQSVDVVTTAAMTPPSPSSYPIYLPPRLAQPARLNFRWLSASQGEVEVNDHPATTPICGWILPNYLDNSLMVYETGGQPLGTMRVQEGQPRWLPMPGRDSVRSIEEIKSQVNPYLGQMLAYAVNQNEGFFADFLTTVNTALESIEPDNYAEHQSIALMMGRPLALVRTRVNLELQGRPGLSQNAGDTRADVLEEEEYQPRTTHDFAKVKLPIRIGEYRQFNDALVGYWIENGDNTYQEDLFYAPQSVYVPNDKIKTLFENQGDDTPDTPVNLEQTLAPETAQTLAMLVDPRGKVHGTCGFLPAKAIAIPPEQYAKALKAIEVTFLSAPIISDRDRLKISLPDDGDYTWSWLAKEGDSWVEIEAIEKFDTKATFAGSNKIREGWLKLSQVSKTEESS